MTGHISEQANVAAAWDDESTELRRVNRDLVAMTALPLLLRGRDLEGIAAVLSDVVYSTLRLDIVYVKLRTGVGAAEHHALRTGAHNITGPAAEEVGRPLSERLDDQPDEAAVTCYVSDLGPVTAARFAVGLESAHGEIVAGCRAATFPTADERLLLGVAGNQAAAAVENARLLAVAQEEITERRRAEEAIREYSRELETLHRVGRLLSAELDLQRLVQIVTDECTALCGAAFGSLFYNVVNELGESYQLYTLSGAPQEAFESFPMPRATAVFAPTFQGSGVVRSDDITADPRYGKSAPHYGMPPGHLPVRSYLAVPVLSRSSGVLGGLLFGHPEVGIFTERHEQTLLAIAAQAAIAMDNAQLYNAAQLEIAERTRAEQALRARQTEIEGLNERLRRAMQETHHRVKNNLQIMAAMIDMQVEANPNTVRIDELNRLSTHVRTLAAIHDVLTRQSRDGQSDHLSARAVMEGLLAMLSATVPGRRITAIVDDVALPTQHSTSLALVVNELVSNALKHSDGSIGLRLSLAAGELVLEVADEGSGFPTGFDPEVAGHTGLELVASVCQWDLRGKVTFANRPEGGAIVRVAFPLPEGAVQ